MKSFERIAADETKQEHDTRTQLSKSSTKWLKGQLGVNANGVKFEINKVTAKRVKVRQLLPYKNGRPALFMDQLLADFDNPNMVMKIDDNFLWGAETGYIQRFTGDELKDWPKPRGAKRRRSLKNK